MQTKKLERRRAARVKLSQTIRIQPIGTQYPEEICKTSNVSRSGLYFETWSGHYFRGLSLFVTRNFRSGDFTNVQETGTVVRVDNLPRGNFGIAVHLGPTIRR